MVCYLSFLILTLRQQYAVKPLIEADIIGTRFLGTDEMTVKLS